MPQENRISKTVFNIIRCNETVFHTSELIFIFVFSTDFKNIFIIHNKIGFVAQANAVPGIA